MASEMRKEWRDAKSQLDKLGIDLHKQFKAMGISPQDLGPALDTWEKAVEAYDKAKGGSSEEQKAKKQMKKAGQAVQTAAAHYGKALKWYVKHASNKNQETALDNAYTVVSMSILRRVDNALRKFG